MSTRNITPSPILPGARLLVLAREGPFSSRIGKCLDSIVEHRPVRATTLGAAESLLKRQDFDVVIAEVHSEFGDGLRLPCLLKSLRAAGRGTRIPHVLWTGQDAAGSPAPLHADDDEPQTFCGVSMIALQAHARLAATAGIQVEIATNLAPQTLHISLGQLLATPALGRTPPNAADEPPTEDAVIAALTSGEGLRVVFQPQFDLIERKIVGAEVLVRWRHARYGDVPPTALLPVVSRLGLDLLLFSYIERRAIEALQLLDNAGLEMPLAVNASPETICAPGLAERLALKMRRAGLPASRLTIEMTEDAPSFDTLCLSASVASLRAKGFQVSLDDFGAGSATLALLSQVPFDELKIDGALVRAALPTARSREIISSIVDLARTFNLRLVVEGIEDSSTIGQLCELGCRIGQGYALARPMEAADFMQLAANEAPERSP